MTISFEWDPAKAAANERKHGISFSEARSVFFDEEALLLSDDDHSDVEERFVLLGVSTQLRMLVVCHCYRTSNDVIRIISARKASRSERAQYQRSKRG